MSEWFWKKLDIWIGYGVIALLLGVVFLEANIEIKDLDLWLHIGAGRYIVENLSFPRVDIFSSTVAGSPWINHEWLFQVIVYFAYSLGGTDGLIALQVVLVCLTFAMLLMLGYRTEKQTGVICIAFCVFMVYQSRFTHRPDLFSLLFLVVYIRTLAVGLKDRASVWVVFIVQAFWANIHGFFILGPALLAVALLSEWLKGAVRLPFEWNGIGRIDRQDLKRLKILFLVSVAACFINPHTVEGAFYPIKILLGMGGDSGVFFKNIGELTKPILLGNIFVLSKYFYLKILILVTAVSFFVNYRKIEIGALALFIIFVVMALKAARNGPYFAFIAFFAFLSNYQYFSARDIFSEQLIRRHVHYIFSIGLKVSLGVLMLHHFSSAAVAGYFDFDRYQRKSEYGGVSLRAYPKKAVDFLVANDIKGKFFNDFNSGSYLIGRAFPNIKVFIDGRTEVYGTEFFKEYKESTESGYKKFAALLNKYQLTGVFLSSVDMPVSPKIIKGLYEDKEWKLVYFDYDAAIFLRNIPSNAKWIDQFEIDFKHWEAPKVDYARLGAVNASAFRQIRVAYGLFNMGQFEKAEAQAREVLKIVASDVKAFNLLGKAAMERGDYISAFENLRKAKVVNVNDMEVRYNLGKCLLHLGRIPEAEKQCRTVLSRAPKDSKALFLLSQIYVKQKRYDQAVSLAGDAYQVAPYETDLLGEVAEALKEAGRHDRAEEINAMMLNKVSIPAENAE